MNTFSLRAFQYRLDDLGVGILENPQQVSPTPPASLTLLPDSQAKLITIHTHSLLGKLGSP